jgi:hypothetical protein
MTSNFRQQKDLRKQSDLMCRDAIGGWRHVRKAAWDYTDGILPLFFMDGMPRAQPVGWTFMSTVHKPLIPAANTLFVH